MTFRVVYLFDDQQCDHDPECVYDLAWIVDCGQCHPRSTPVKVCNQHMPDHLHRLQGCRSVVTPWYTPPQEEQR